MKKIFSMLFCAVALFSFVSCSDDEGTVTPPIVFSDTKVIYTLNSGKFNSNNASLSSYGVDSEIIVDDMFMSVNGQGLGDTAQDMVTFGDKIFISVYNSGVIFVTDLKGEIITTITDDTYFNPRYLATDDNNVYVSYYDGAVAKINPSTYELTTTAVTAPGTPEELDVVNGKIYVAVADYGYGNEQSVVSVFDASTLAFSHNIDVVANPTTLAADSAGNVYVISMGDYYSIPQTLQRINTASNDDVTTLNVTGGATDVTTCIVIGKDNTLYTISGVSDYTTNYKMVGSVYAYNPTTGASSEFITDNTSVSNMYSISSNMSTGEIYVGTSDYTNTGDIYVFNADGTLQTTFGVGLNPMKAIAVKISAE